MVQVLVVGGSDTTPIALSLGAIYGSSANIFPGVEKVSGVKTIDILFLSAQKIVEFDCNPLEYKKKYGAPNAKVIAFNKHQSILNQAQREKGVDYLYNTAKLLEAFESNEVRLGWKTQQVLRSFLPGSNEGEDFMWLLISQQSNSSCCVCGTQPVAGSYFKGMEFFTSSVDSANRIKSWFGKNQRNIVVTEPDEDGLLSLSFATCRLHGDVLDQLKKKTEFKKLITENIVTEVLTKA